MKKIIFISFIISVLLITPLVVFALSANDIEIEINIKDSFGLNETVNFDYTITAKNNVEIVYLPYVECPNAPQAFLVQETAELKANQPFTESYQSIRISDFIEPQICTAFVQIVSPIEKRLEKEFEIITKPSFDLQILACKDQACQQPTKVYQKNESVYLQIKTDVQGVSAQAEVIDPKNNSNKITLPAVYELKRTGKYNFNITAEAAGYKTNNQKLQLVVLGGPPTVIDTRICNQDGKCDAQESYQNCPNDCPLKVGLIGFIKDKLFLIISVALIVIVIVIVFILWRLRKKIV